MSSEEEFDAAIAEIPCDRELLYTLYPPDKFTDPLINPGIHLYDLTNPDGMWADAESDCTEVDRRRLFRALAEAQAVLLELAGRSGWSADERALCVLHMTAEILNDEAAAIALGFEQP